MELLPCSSSSSTEGWMTPQTIGYTYGLSNPSQTRCTSIKLNVRSPLGSGLFGESNSAISKPGFKKKKKRKEMVSNEAWHYTGL